MSIPLDQLYHYIENVAQEIYSDRIIIYRFYPHGSKNINNLTIKNPWIMNFIANIFELDPKTH